MSLFLPKTEGLEPWEAVIQMLEAKGDAANDLFQSVQRRGNGLAGYITGGWDNHGDLKWWDTGGTYDPWESVNDDRVPERPYIYRKLGTIRRRMERLAEIARMANLQMEKYTSKRPAHIGLLYWIHPEAHFQPLEDYIRLTEGARFPGSPRH